MGKAEYTKETILDAAEARFADAGYDTVSMRHVADGAGVPLGLINYHFGTKEKLFEAVIARRAEELNARRREALSAVGKMSPATVEAVLGAFLRPYLELTLRGGAGWRSYGKLIAETGQSHRWCTLITNQFGELANRFIDALVKAEPRLTRELAARGYVHMVSVMVGIFAANELLDIVSGGKFTSRDLERAYDCAMPFLTGAFHGFAAHATSVGTTKPPARPRTPARTVRH
ncbi:MAG: TetR family transcriptional regulator [Rhizobiales bacterium]|nr:TetR family transcriptional regulator [Hyphomicrobiales bacterium]